MTSEQGRPAVGGGLPRSTENYGQADRGFKNAVSRSSRPKKNPLPLDLDNHGRLHSWSTGTPNSKNPAPEKNAGPPSLGPVPRGYVHNEPGFNPTVRNMNGDRLKKGND